MKLIISTIDENIFEIKDFDMSTAMDMKEALDNPDQLFHQFDMDGEIVLLNKIQIVSIEFKE